MANEQSSNDPKKTTPDQWSNPKDARDMQGAGEYPNYWTHRTRSGHVFTLDDSQGAEHVTLQHRGGSMIQFMPDGAVQFVSHNGQYNMVFGENRIKITGAYDVTVEGGGSLKVDGDYNVTVKGDTKFAVGGNFNLTAQNFNQLIGEDISIVAKNRTEKVSGAISQSADGSQHIVSKKSMSVASTEDSTSVGATKQLGLYGGEKVLMGSPQDVHIRSKESNVNIMSNKSLNLLAETSGVYVQAKDGDINVKSDSGKLAMQSQGDMSIKSEGGQGSIHASSTLYLKGDSLTDINNSTNDIEPDNAALSEYAKDDFTNSGKYESASDEGAKSYKDAGTAPGGSTALV